MAARPDIVITGSGVVSPIGIGCEAFWSSLCNQQSGIGVLSGISPANAPYHIGAEIHGFEPKSHITPRKALKVMSREVQTGFCAARMAADEARLTAEQVSPERLGVMFGAQMLYCEPVEMETIFRRCSAGGAFDFSRWGEASVEEIFPLWMLKYLPNMIGSHIGIAFDARGPSSTICQGEASSLLALIEAAWIIQRGDTDAMIVGASSSRISPTPMVFRTTANLSCRADSPQTACRPFDACRDGSVNGEAAAAFVVENEQFARSRGATILARVTGWGYSFGSLDGDGDRHLQAIRHSIRTALEAARLQPGDVGHVNANAAGIVARDPLEAQAIRAELGDVPVTAPKSFFGDSGAASGAAEMAVSVAALTRGEIPVTLNYEQPDPLCPVNVIHGRPQPVGTQTALVLSQAPAGQAIAVVLERADA